MFFIYRIFKEGDENAYIGSTNDFVRRRYEHKNRCCNPNSSHHNYKIYQHITEHGGWDAWTMSLIEESESRDREKELIRLLKPTLNIQKSLTSKEHGKEYRETNKRKEYVKEYKKINKVRINAKNVEYRENNKEKSNKKYDCECGGKYTHNHKARHFKTNQHQKYLSSDTHDSIS